jgi:hypothetical protein
VPVALFTLAGFNLINLKWVEGSLYLFMGLGFTLMGLLRAGRIKRNREVWNSISWVLVAVAVVLFILLLRMDAYEL